MALLVAIYVVAELWDPSDLVRGVIWALAFVAFLVALRALEATPRTVYANAIVVAILLSLAITGLAIDQDGLAEPAGIAAGLYAFVAPVLILRHTMQRRTVTMDVIFGALAVYVFVGIDFAIIFDTIQRVDPAAFAGEPVSPFYFSFVTLTTVGFGDITPVSDLARTLTVIEALVGQILLVVIVARLVGLQIAQSVRGDDAG